MQQFTIPQFIDVEDKIIGPITTRQFIIMLVAFLIGGISYKIFDFSLFITISLLVIIICGIFAFVKINGRPFHFFALNLIQTLKRPKLRVWNHKILLAKDSKQVDESKIIAKSISVPPKKFPTISRLAELSLIVDTQGAYRGEGEETETKIKFVNNNN